MCNVMGLLSHSDIFEDCLHETNPDVFTLTETKMKPYLHHNSTGKSLQKDVFRGYIAFFSSVPTDGQVRPRGKAGVIVGVRNAYIPPGSFTKMQTDKKLNGYICHTTLRTPGHALAHIVGVNMPEDTIKRKLIYTYIQDRAIEYALGFCFERKMGLFSCNIL